MEGDGRGEPRVVASTPVFEELSQADRREVLFEVRDGCLRRLAREFWGARATSYADRHLNEIRRQAEGWEVVYRCARTNVEWVLARPLSEGARRPACPPPSIFTRLSLGGEVLVAGSVVLRLKFVKRPIVLCREGR